MAPPAAPRAPSAGEIALRVLASLLGSYALVWGFVSFVTAAGARLTTFTDARTLAYLLAFLVFLFCFCWAFVERSLLRVWALLLGSGGVLTALAWLLTRGSS